MVLGKQKQGAEFSSKTYTEYASFNAYRIHQSKNPLSLGQHSRTIGIWENRHETEAALLDLQLASFPMEKIAIIVGDERESITFSGKETFRVHSSFMPRRSYILVVNGTAEEIRSAEMIISSPANQEWGVYNTRQTVPSRVA